MSLADSLANPADDPDGIAYSERGPASIETVASFGFWLFLLSDVVIMGLFVLGLTGLALDWAIRQFERFVTPWRFA